MTYCICSLDILVIQIQLGWDILYKCDTFLKFILLKHTTVYASICLHFYDSISNFCFLMIHSRLKVNLPR